MDLNTFRKMLHIEKVPFYALPRTLDVTDGLKYDTPSFTIQRNVKKGSIINEEVIRISKRLQKKIYKSLINLKPPYMPYTIGISSEPNDVFALQLAGYIHYALFTNNINLKWKWWNSYYYLRNDKDYNYDVVFIYNAMHDSNRAQRIRDIITNLPLAIRIVVIAGTNAIDFFDNEIQHGLSGAIHVTGQGEAPYTFKKSPKIIKKDKDITKIFSDDLIPLLNTLKKSVNVIQKGT
jgi:hypothetical protein